MTERPPADDRASGRGAAAGGERASYRGMVWVEQGLRQREQAEETCDGGEFYEVGREDGGWSLEGVAGKQGVVVVAVEGGREDR